MAKFAVLFSIESDALSRFIDNPSDRRESVGQLAQAAGGSLEAYYWMFGQYDGLAIFDVPNSQAMAAAALVATATGAFRKFETHELIEADELVQILQRAKESRGSYTPPGGNR